MRVFKVWDVLTGDLYFPHSIGPCPHRPYIRQVNLLTQERSARTQTVGKWEWGSRFIVNRDGLPVINLTPAELVFELTQTGILVDHNQLNSHHIRKILDVFGD